MSPQDHYDKAERLLEDFEDAEFPTLISREAQVHATLALAGFTRDASPKPKGYPG